MYLKRLILENLRGFRHLDFDLERAEGERYAGWTVITGDNASGKTAILKAIAMALVGTDTMRSLQPSYAGWIRGGQSEAVIAVEMVPDSADHFRQGRKYERPFWAELKLAAINGNGVSLAAGKKYNKGRQLGPTHGPWAENPDGWFCAGYGPFRRLYGASPDAQRLMSGPSRVARFATLFKEDATLGECEIWLKELSHKSLENPGSKESKLLVDVVGILNDDLLLNGVRVEGVNSEGLWLKQPNGLSLPLADMSDGYRSALAMVVDIIRHLNEVYGYNEWWLSSDGQRKQVNYPGVILIDEVDSHLHPEWQRKIGFWLKGIFPRIQFIVTTHSTLICQAADHDSVFTLPPAGSDLDPFRLMHEDYLKIIRGTPDQIYLTPAFNMDQIRSPRVVRAQRDHARLSAKKSAVGRLVGEEIAQMEQTEMFLEPEEEVG